MSYSEDLADYISQAHSNEAAPLGRGIPVTVRELIAALSKCPDGEVFIEVDRNLVDEIDTSGDAMDLLPHLWPIAIRYDEEGDVIIHATDGDRAQI